MKYFLSSFSFAINTIADITFANISPMAINDTMVSYIISSGDVLRYGANKVVAIDVGTDLMADSLRNDSRVELYEQMNFKNAPSKLFESIDIIVSDVSFISLKHIIERIF